MAHTRPTWPLLVFQGNKSREKRTDVLSSLSRLAGVSKRRATRTHLDTITEIVGNAPSKIKDYADWLGVDKASLKKRGTN